jgi:hypothetical protein
VEFAIETSEDGRAKAISVSGPEGSFVQVSRRRWKGSQRFPPRRPTTTGTVHECMQSVACVGDR